MRNNKLAQPFCFTILPSDTKNASRGDAFRCVIRCALRRYFPGQIVSVSVSFSHGEIVVTNPKKDKIKSFILPDHVSLMARQWDEGAKWTDKIVEVEVTHGDEVFII